MTLQASICKGFLVLGDHTQKMLCKRFVLSRMAVKFHAACSICKNFKKCHLFPEFPLADSAWSPQVIQLLKVGPL